MNPYFHDDVERWQQNLQQIGGKLLFHGADEWGDILVTGHKRLRVLTFDTVHEQSCMDLKRPEYLVHEYARVMMLGLLMTEPDNALLLGLGGGSLVRSLMSVRPNTSIQVVEIRPKVVDVAREFFGLPDNSETLNVAIGDAKVWLKHAESSTFNIVFADLYQAQGISEFQTQARFLKACDRVLTDDGCLVANFHDIPPYHSPFFAALNEMFAEIWLCRVDGGNTILFACKQDVGADLKELLFPNAEALGDAMGCHLQPAVSRLVRVDMG